MKYYWLKLGRGFFRRHDILEIRNRSPKEKGRERVLFYLNLLLESIDHEGELRFSDDIPYDNEKLANILDADIAVATQTMEILEELKLVRVDKNKTIKMMKLDEMIGRSTKEAERKRKQRSKKEEINAPEDLSGIPEITEAAKKRIYKEIVRVFDLRGWDTEHLPKVAFSKCAEAIKKRKPKQVYPYFKKILDNHINQNAEIYADQSKARNNSDRVLSIKEILKKASNE